MAISPISLGASGTSGFAGGNEGGMNAIPRKISQLEKQKQDYEAVVKDTSDPTVKGNIEGKITGLERRIDTLKSRLEKQAEENGECETCKNRKYQDGSDDPGVSFKNATKISPEAVASAVRGHEMEHVYRNRAKAAREDREVVSQSVVIKTAICPECGKSYVAGGETKTVTRAKQADRYSVGREDPSLGNFMDLSA